MYDLFVNIRFLCVFAFCKEVTYGESGYDGGEEEETEEDGGAVS